jgi:hypothetical protein
MIFYTIITLKRHWTLLLNSVFPNMNYFTIMQPILYVYFSQFFIWHQWDRKKSLFLGRFQLERWLAIVSKRRSYGRNYCLCPVIQEVAGVLPSQPPINKKDKIQRGRF